MEHLTARFENQNSTLQVILSGKLTLMDALTLKDELPKKAEGYEAVSIDMMNVTEIDLTGFNALLMTKRQIGNKEVKIKVDSKHGIHDLIHLTKFDNLFTIQN